MTSHVPPKSDEEKKESKEVGKRKKKLYCPGARVHSVINPEMYQKCKLATNLWYAMSCSASEVGQGKGISVQICERRSEEVKKLAKCFKIWTPPETREVGQTVKLAQRRSTSSVGSFQNKTCLVKSLLGWEVWAATVLLFQRPKRQLPVYFLVARC